MDLGAVLKAARERRGYTQEQLADRLNRSRTCITKFERNSKEISWKEAIRWGQVTNAQDLLIAAMVATDPIQITQIIEQINQLSQFVGMVLGGIL
ncbi:helix-turn-helix domain-containing protein [Salipaludibacillus aurantiacus]|uniref:DNA-binding transcriptional regulator, XRE-family HTH domain n=1 Tax=Salipaludibacillus aurantiacus TaxID=1601833 RepID=A0A1H9U179_9BACI|nr:helix-turn-helix transcriptional regulator [Salipaludibacillus aurantiacus]SES03225.1 DNA-binding transcriptional regulator, XRE-family HTH domain [Salipaludibacillus aurantiacus]